jgi:ClpP class serine protease
MTRLVYYLEPSALKAYLASKDDLSAAKNGMTAEGIKLAISEIYKAAHVHRAPAQTNIVIGMPDSPAPAADGPLYSVDADGVAHIAVEGLLVSQANPCAAFFAEAETEYGFIRAAALAADADPLVREIAFNINSPGGYADGLDETAITIAGLAKPTRSDVHDLAASAAYWLASQTDKIVSASPAALFGSIGVAMEIIDHTGADAQRGIKRKSLTSTDAPLKRPDLTTDEGQAVLIKELDDLHAVFASRVAEGRGVSVARVNKDFGKGGVLIAADALKVGMIDDIAGLSIARNRQPAGVAGDKTAAKADGTLKTGGANSMTLEELKRDHPDLYAAVFSAGEASGKVKGVTEGVTQERARVTALEKWIAADAGNEKVAQIVAEAKTTGKAEADVLAQLQVAVRDGKTETLDPDNAEHVRTQAGNGTVNPEAVRIGAKMGVTAADIAKHGGEPRKE